MTFNDAGLQLLKSFESCRLKAYPDPGTGEAPYTIGYGATGPGIESDSIWTQEQADSRLMDDIIQFSIGVKRLLQVDISDNQFSALVCFAYNCGVHALASSHLLSKLNDGDYSGAADEFLKWDRAGGAIMPGLLRRRQAEQDLFLS